MTREQASNILAEYVKACREDDMLKLEEFSYEEVIDAMEMGTKALTKLNHIKKPEKEQIAAEIHHLITGCVSNYTPENQHAHKLLQKVLDFIDKMP